MTKIRRWIAILFIIYILYLIWAVLLKFSFSYSEIPFRRQSVNLDPFYLLRGSYVSPVIVREKLMNIFIFIPFGAYLYLLGARKFPSNFLIIVLTSVLLEIMQYAFSLGTCDIADIITNAIGGVMGYFLTYITLRVTNREERVMKHFTIISSVVTPVVIIGTLWLKVKYG
ncbi:MAG: VanZ family protein [Lachnospiraceae bacterium]|nr:VanZ family protein [Lachnospiraceae bacterium]